MYLQLLCGKIRVDFRDMVLPNGERGTLIMPVPNAEVLDFFGDARIDVAGGQWNWVECYPIEWVEFLNETAKAIRATNEGQSQLGMIGYLLDTFSDFVVRTHASSFKSLDRSQRYAA